MGHTQTAQRPALDLAPWLQLQRAATAPTHGLPGQHMAITERDHDSFLIRLREETTDNETYG